MNGSMPCKVSFERGKERQVHLVVVSGEISGSLLLIENIAFKQNRGVIRVAAPLAGSDVSIWPIMSFHVQLNLSFMYYSSENYPRDVLFVNDK